MIRTPLITAIIILILIAGSIHAQTNQTYFKFDIESNKEINTLTRLISIDNVVGSTIYAYATNDQFDHFKTLGYEYSILPNPGTLYQPRMSDDRQTILEWDAYPTYGAYVDMMYQFAIDYPALCAVENIGFSVQGREILFAKLSANIGSEEYEPEVMYSSTMHGDETTGYILLLRLIDYLLSNYGIDPQATDILNNMEVWINPLANPDGTYITGNESVYGAQRNNANNYDLNRNFPDPDEGQNPGGPHQPETIAMMDFFDEHSFVISANFHGGAEVVNYPWDTWPQRHADDSWFIQICHEYADSAQANSPSGYMAGFDDGITNGWDWYSISGGRQDYLNYWKGCRENTIELSNTKLLPENQLDDHWNYNRAALITYIEQAYYGIKGTVTDANTGLPIEAIISVIGHDIDSSEVYTDPDIGDYHRMIDDGTYDLQFNATGYITQTVSGVNVIDRAVTYIDVQMQPIPNEPWIELLNHNAEYVNPGDNVLMSITLVNHGGGNAEGVSAELSTSDSYINVLQPSSTYPDITELGGTGVSDAEYQFEVSSDCPTPHQVDFQLYVTASGGYSTTISFNIAVDNIEIVFSDDFSTNQGWTGLGGDGEWEIGSPSGLGGEYGSPDPTADHSTGDDNQILGNDLNNDGDYENDLSECWVISPVIDCSDYTNVTFTFFRWLGVERNLYDHAYIEIYDGAGWTQIFEHPSTTISESSWNEQVYDISTWADYNPNLQIRFGIGTTDNSWRYCGWNIDDIIITGELSSQIIETLTTEPLKTAT